MVMRVRAKLVRVRNYTRRIIKRAEGKRRQELVRHSQYIRRVAMNSIKRPSRKRKRSVPGKPPFNRTGALKYWIRYAWEPATQTCVIGAVRLNHMRIPRALEHGGISKFVRRTRYFWAGGYQRTRRHPFMRPALIASLPRMRRITQEIYR